ncbi:uncharacterized protein LOC122950645 [Acropora millepora]|uniref:uncharacterized protein LOC122950645 n=1 Tax=Acropora millepora TaxID=45264 RepID=UPI001CF12AB0|nr:uncharacterized protein LOC122950645 [Acropora millepora]
MATGTLDDEAKSTTSRRRTTFSPMNLPRTFHVKKLALRKNLELRREYQETIDVFRPEEIVFLDQCFFDRGVTRNYGYNVRAQIATGRYVNPSSPRVTSISAVSYEGLIAEHLTRKTFNGRRLKLFLRNEIAPQLQPYNRVNDRSVVVMDNHAAHHVAGVEQIVEAAGAILLYLPPYCPELNPIEEIFSIVKESLGANHLMFLITPDPQEMVYMPEQLA